MDRWNEFPIPEILTQCIGKGGCLVAASTAALTVGRLTLPVYKIYKVGHDLHRVDSMDILEPSGNRCLAGDGRRTRDSSELRIAAEMRLVKTCHRILAPTDREKNSLMRYYGVCGLIIALRVFFTTSAVA